MDRLYCIEVIYTHTKILKQRILNDNKRNPRYTVSIICCDHSKSEKFLEVKTFNSQLVFFIIWHQTFYTLFHASPFYTYEVFIP